MFLDSAEIGITTSIDNLYEDRVTDPSRPVCTYNVTVSIYNVLI